MAIDPRNLRPAELCRLLNSTPLGAVINERQLYRHRNRAGYRLGDDNRIDLLKYVAWLVEEVHRPPSLSAKLARLVKHFSHMLCVTANGATFFRWL